ncbi:hypothetical protein BGX28_006020 [Mortierella sp. GBA30]|nr:hypothetical protein BGX28_006020 [Mortierella sp. GBA30]
MASFIRLRKYEALSLQYVLHEFRTSDCTWLQDTRLRTPDSPVAHIPQTASMKQREILHEFVYWLFNGFLVPLLKSAFYITDSSFQRNKIGYYRHGLWHLISQHAMKMTKENMLIKMEPYEVTVCSRPYAGIRFLPKENDLRPITNLGRKSPKTVNGVTPTDTNSINRRLRNPKLVLDYEMARGPSAQGRSATGFRDLYCRIRQAKDKLVGTATSNLPKLYMVKVDIKKSFDSINQEKLLSIIESTLREEKYTIHQHCKVIPVKGRIAKRFLPNATAPSELPPFLDYARSQAETSKHAVLVDKVVHTYERKALILNQIREHIKENIVKFGRRFYRQTTGIPQGSVLSPALCRTLEIRFDYSRYHGEDIRNLLTVERIHHPGRSIAEKMKTAILYACQTPFTDTSYNSFSTVLLNIYQNFIFCAMRFHAYCQELRLDPVLTQHVQPDALSTTIFDILQASYALLLSHRGGDGNGAGAGDSNKSFKGATTWSSSSSPSTTTTTPATAIGVKYEISERHVYWLGATAFCRTLPAFPIYDPLKVALQETILDMAERNEKMYFKRILNSVVKDERNKILEGIHYK